MTGIRYMSRPWLEKAANKNMPIFLNNRPNLKTTFANCRSLAPSAGILLLGIMSLHILTPQEVSGTLSSISRIWEIVQCMQMVFLGFR